MKIKKKKKNKTGFTLIEILIAFSLVSFVILGIVALYSADFNIFSANIRNSQLQNESEMAMEHMVEHIRGKSLEVTITNDTPVGSGNDYLQVKWDNEVPPNGCQYQLKPTTNELQYCDSYSPWCANPLSVANSVSKLEFSDATGHGLLVIPTDGLLKIDLSLAKDDKNRSMSSQLKIEKVGF
ncbi:MAG: prepilin-type N-terminal cleavage/methylation domain-containing protein [Candidatus Omnitrophica bacterium]|nr:prepilin-type N-terminal cleavage/methylation domain-containing protein [Candidatus Omnitrophota bacterium]